MALRAATRVHRHKGPHVPPCPSPHPSNLLPTHDGPARPHVRRQQLLRSRVEVPQRVHLLHQAQSQLAGNLRTSGWVSTGT